ncbi:MAG: hypothetical protein A2V74_07415 [Acidobacteria bacterium RBG_16_70_10]|nr:MAG: hypothetical protein A2V74_07415 [Acidobacteria bacterium RBG_16_70_10]
MQIREVELDDVLVVAPAGRVDSTSSTQLEQLLFDRLDGGSRRMIVDLAGIDYISSAGLRVLLWLAKRMQAEKGDLVLCGMGEPVRQVFELAGLLPLFAVEGTRDEALTRLGRKST